MLDNKAGKKGLIIGPEFRFDTRIVQKKEEKVINYEPLKFEFAGLWILKKATNISVVFGVVDNNCLAAPCFPACKSSSLAIVYLENSYVASDSSKC